LKQLLINQTNSPICSQLFQIIILISLPVEVNSSYPETKVLANVVAGIYAPLIHAFSNTILKNIESGILPPIILAPPRDAIPLANSLRAMADIKGQKIQIIEIPVNRNTAGIFNNQKMNKVEKSPYLDLLFDQTISSMNSTNSVVEIETGIYGTTSLVMAQAFKSKNFEHYHPLKFYGLGPNLSFVHAVLSDGNEWIAENVENTNLMVLLDTMEELGMEKFYKSVEHLKLDSDGIVKPVLVPVSPQEFEIASITNQVIIHTAAKYSELNNCEVKNMLNNIGTLTAFSKNGFPLTLSDAIPSMDSKEEHFNNIKNSKLFDYPLLKL